MDDALGLVVFWLVGCVLLVIVRVVGLAYADDRIQKASGSRLQGELIRNRKRFKAGFWIAIPLWTLTNIVIYGIPMMS